MARGSRYRNNRRYACAHSTSRQTPTPRNKLYKTSNGSSNIMIPSAIALYLLADASHHKKKLEEESQTEHRTSADNSEDDKCKIQYSNMLDCLKNNPESQCEQFIKSMEECVNEV